MPDADFTIAANTWWTTGANAGSGDGSSFVDRKAIPTGVGAGILNLVVNADANLTVVLETASGAIVLGNNAVAAKTFTCYGGFFTVDSTNAAITPDNPCAYRLAIGGSTSYRCGAMTMYGNLLAGNVDWGQDSANAATCNVEYGFTSSYVRNQYQYNCTFKNYFATGNGYMILGGAYEDCTFYGHNNGAGYVIRYGMNPTLINCTQITTGTYWLLVPASIGASAPVIVGNLTQGGAGGAQIYFTVANTYALFKFYRRAFLKATTDGTTALSGVSYGAYEAAGGVDMPLSSGVTGADGLCYPESPTNYNRGIWALQKVEKYIRATAGAMTWGTPTSTDTYGNYTFVHAKTGYTPLFTTHDFTDGLDYGSAATPTAVTLVATKANYRVDGGTW